MVTREAAGPPQNRGLAEEIAGLKPDLVVADLHAARTATGLLRRIGIPVLDFSLPADPEWAGRHIPGVCHRFQGGALGWSVRVMDVVALSRLPHWRAFAGVVEADYVALQHAMCLAEIEHLAQRPGPSLFSGERMRVLLARAVVVEALILLTDEPVTRLDPAHQLDAMAFLRSVAHRGVAVIVVLHHLTLAARLCDRLIVLAEGRVAADGLAREALGDWLLLLVFGIAALRGTREDCTLYLLPWDRLPGPLQGRMP